MLSRKKLASLAGWIPVALVFEKLVVCPVGVPDCSMAPTLRGPSDIDDGNGDRKRKSSNGAASTSTSSSSPSLFSVARSGGDVVLVDKLAAKTYNYKRGDVVLMRSLDEPGKTLIRRLVAVEGDWVAPSSTALGGSSDGSSGSGAGGGGGSGDGSGGGGLLPRGAPRAEVPKGHIWVEADSPGQADETSTAAPAAAVGLGGTPFFLPPQHPSDADTAAGAPVPAALVDGVVRGVVWPPGRAGEVRTRPERAGRVVRLQR